jgi:hypothetical protein
MAEVIEKTHECEHKHEEIPYGKINAGLTTGIIGTALGGLNMLTNGKGLLNLFGGNNCNNCNNQCNCPGSDITAQSNSMTPESLYLERKECADYLDITKQYYEGRLIQKNELTNAFFDAYKRDVDNSFALYKLNRDSNDALMSRIAEVDKKVDIMAAVRPYQDALIDCKINTNALLANYALDKRTCRMIEGQLVLPSTPVISGYGSYSACVPSQSTTTNG